MSCCLANGHEQGKIHYGSDARMADPSDGFAAPGMATRGASSDGCCPMAGDRRRGMATLSGGADDLLTQRCAVRSRGQAGAPCRRCSGPRPRGCSRSRCPTRCRGTAVTGTADRVAVKHRHAHMPARVLNQGGWAGGLVAAPGRPGTVSQVGMTSPERQFRLAADAKVDHLLTMPRLPRHASGARWR